MITFYEIALLFYSLLYIKFCSSLFAVSLDYYQFRIVWLPYKHQSRHSQWFS